eukprot:TRINITY_DN16288_c0_g1_i1.p1 TRINITY_DN16288_c0_g1~~TRINITY_DN16288_c0_g1_i1.p1  ORF type:complete len:460 (+),score=99.11 TRINITY_DN16288_c0_g1_i1:72-1451(+)
MAMEIINPKQMQHIKILQLGLHPDAFTLQSLPNEILLKIVAYLTKYSTFMFSQSCKFLFGLISSTFEFKVCTYIPEGGAGALIVYGQVTAILQERRTFLKSVLRQLQREWNILYALSGSLKTNEDNPGLFLKIIELQYTLEKYTSRSEYTHLRIPKSRHAVQSLLLSAPSLFINHQILNFIPYSPSVPLYPLYQKNCTALIFVVDPYSPLPLLKDQLFCSLFGESYSHSKSTQPTETGPRQDMENVHNRLVDENADESSSLRYSADSHAPVYHNYSDYCDCDDDEERDRYVDRYGNKFSDKYGDRFSDGEDDRDRFNRLSDRYGWSLEKKNRLNSVEEYYNKLKNSRSSGEKRTTPTNLSKKDSGGLRKHSPSKMALEATLPCKNLGEGAPVSVVLILSKYNIAPEVDRTKQEIEEGLGLGMYPKWFTWKVCMVNEDSGDGYYDGFKWLLQTLANAKFH